MNRYTWRTLGLEAAMVTAALVIVFPVYVLVNLALKAPSDTSSPLRPPSSPTLSNFSRAWEQGALGSAMVNSVIVTVVSVAVIIGVSAPASHTLARVTHRWSRWVFLLIMLGLLLPFQLAMLPLYQTMRDLNLLGTVWGLILFYSGLQVPFTVFLYTGFLRAMPKDYEEAALIDGCDALQAFRYVVFPLLKPITATAVVLNAVFIWNDFFTPLLYVSGSPHQTVPVAVAGFVGQYVSQWNLIFAALIISIVPILALYLALQRYIISGVAGGLTAGRPQRGWPPTSTVGLPDTPSSDHHHPAQPVLPETHRRHS